VIETDRRLGRRVAGQSHQNANAIVVNA
jgi:hypothetical protein